MQERGCVVVLSKPARPGRVKTRLIGELSPAQAAALHQAFLEDLLERLRGGSHEVWMAWAVDEGDELPAGEVPAIRQRGRDLGARLLHALESAGEKHRWCAAVGSDHPELPLERVDGAFEHLAAGADVVLGPAADGGYYLIAVRRESLSAKLFEGIAWSTPAVLPETLERCAALGLKVELLALGHDVDTPEDLPRLAAFLGSNREECPRTRGLFERWGLAP